MRKLILSAVLAGLSLCGGLAHAADIQAGQQYMELPNPVPVAQPGKIEVVELFWYGCPHCYEFESDIAPWSKKLPDDVKFVRIPAMFGGIWNVHGQAFLTLEAMGAASSLHQAVFDAYHKDGKKLATPEAFADFVATQGIDRDTFLQTFNSFAIKGQVEKARKLAMAYQVTGVPALIVNGKYRFDVHSSGGPKEALDVANFLIARERTAH